MPSFVSDEESIIYTQSLGIVHIDPAGQYGLFPETDGKANGHIVRQPHPHTSNESLDDGSTQSTHTSDDSDARSPPPPPPNGAPPPPPIMNPPVNGNAVEGVSCEVGRNGSVSRKPLPNGISTTPLGDRTPSSPYTTREGDSPALSAKETFPRSSFGSIQNSPVEMYLHPVNKSEIRTVDHATSPSPLRPPPGSAASNHSAVAPTPSADSSQRNVGSPHRYSSPPLYTGGALTPSSSGALQPPGAGLKHRHTLEVPKPSPARGSRDGVDATFASGRFSPTAAATSVRRASLSLARRNTRSLHSEMPRDEIVPDDDAQRWTEAYRQKRASRRKRREIEDDDRVLVGTKVDESHANWVTAYNMLTGIRVAVSRTNAKIDRNLTDADFDVKQKSTFDIAGNELVPSAKYDFKFKDYAPWVFRHLRTLFRLDPADYLMSLTGKYILSELGSPGKSGSFFYFSRDYKYIIKTIHHAEHKFLRKILKDYYQHVIDNPNTLLSQFYGLHRVKMPYGKKIHFVVMNNLFPPHRDIHQTFDLKGSTIGRDYKEDDLSKNPRATLKDLNWMRRKRHLELGIQKKQMFLAQLQKDVRLLQKLHIMDYSLLVGIHDLKRGNEENLRDKTLRVFNPGGNIPEEQDIPASVLMRTPSKLEGQRRARELRHMIQAEKPVLMGETSNRMPDELEEGQNRPGFVFNQDDGGFRATHEDNTPGDEIYYLGVIDCLTHYGIIKKLENFWKGLSSDRSQISALAPQQYGERFYSFITGITMSQEQATREAQEKDAAMAAAVAAEEEERHRAGELTNHRSSGTVPPIPNYLPPPPPSSSSAERPSHEVEAVVQRAEQEARKSSDNVPEGDVPERILRTTVTSPKHGAVTTPGAGSTVLPIVEEAAENSTMGERGRDSRISSTMTGESDYRPLTPAKDGREAEAGFGNPILGGHGGYRARGPPPTPPKTGHGYGGGKPESADSGYGVVSSNGGLRSATGSQRSLMAQPHISRDSLDKALPPLPRTSEHPAQGVS